MRRLALASTLFLAACAARPEQPPTPQQPAQVVPAQRQGTTRLTGMTIRELTTHFGPPALQVQEGTSLKLQFRGNYCVLDVYLYPGQNGAIQVTHVDTRRTSGVDTDQATCISALEYPS